MTNSEEQYIIDNYKKQTQKEIAIHLGCCLTNVYKVLKKHGLTKDIVQHVTPRAWTIEEKQFLLDNKGKITVNEMAERLGRRYEAVYMKLYKLSTGMESLYPKKAWSYGTCKKNKVKKFVRLSDEEKQYIADNADKTTIRKIAQWIGCADNTVRYHIHKLSAV